jgi:DNA-directed RNA polymerase subunit RPC12/RpoP
MLQPCPECTKGVSDTAETCPHCGYRLLGREHLVSCPYCETEVLPEVHPRDTISRCCPICKRPITNLPGRRLFFVAFGLVFVAVTAVILYTFFRIRTSVLP